jgi:hypothetical protein
MYRMASCRLCLFLLLIMLFSLVDPTGAFAKNADREFTAATRKALTALETGNWKSLSAMTSSSGLIILKREFDLSASSAIADHPVKRTPQNASDGDFDLDDFEPAVYHDREVDLTKSEVARLKSHLIARQLQHLVQNTKQGYRDSIESSLHAMAPEYGTPLGPALVGKVCAGTWWYAYFRQEGAGRWKIWKIEMYSH